MSIFPGNILVIDDQFNVGYQTNEPEAPSQKIQWNNFKRLRHLFDNNGFCYSVITETKNLAEIISRIKKYQNVRLLILDLDLDESGDVEEADIEMVKQIVLASLDVFGYYFLLINSSYSEKWDSIRDELIDDLKKDEKNNLRKIHFLSKFCISIGKSNIEIEDSLLRLLSDKFSSELITQFESKLNNARDKALSPFMDFGTETWDHVYRILKEDMDSREHINFTLNSLLIGLLKQHMLDINYSVPNTKASQVDAELQQSIIKSFNYLNNRNGDLDNHPIWTGNLYHVENAKDVEKYSLVITPECDIAQAKGSGYTLITGFEYELPSDYKPEEVDVDNPKHKMVFYAGKKSSGSWRTKKELEDFYFKGQGFYALLHSSINNKHIVFDLRSAFRVTEIRGSKLHLRVNEPIITDITDKFSALFNRKGIPRLLPKNYL